MDKEEVTPAFYTVNEFAKKLNVHPNTIRRSIRKGHICAFKIGTSTKSSYRISHNEVERITLFDLEKIIEGYMKKREQ